MATNLRLIEADADRSFGSLLQDVGSSVDRLVRAELQLAVAQARDELSAVGNAAMMLGAGALMATLAAGFLLLGGAIALTAVLPMWAAALVVGGIVAVVAIVLLARASSKFSALVEARGHDSRETSS
ncbi:MAG TPA: phage holin family protein [Gemmatimonadales bacterium]|nr:phage holin family protein [Gemmatimonadales bacterium]